MVDSIRTLKKTLKAAERQSARNRQAKYQAARKAEGKRRISVWVTHDDAELIRLLLATSVKSRNNLREYLRRFKVQSS